MFNCETPSSNELGPMPQGLLVPVPMWFSLHEIISSNTLYFLKDSVNLPNLAAMFWSHADEERSHAIQFMQYLRMRGAENNDFFGDTPIQPKEGRFYWSSVDDVRFV